MNRRIVFLLLALFLLIFACKKDSGLTDNGTDESVEENQVIEELLDENGGSADQKIFEPVKKPDGTKFKIAVVRSGEYYMYADQLNYMIETFIEYGWMNDVVITEEARKRVDSTLTELVQKDYSDYIEFSLDNYFDFDWDSSKASNPKFKKIIDNKGEIDVIVSFGTASSKVISSLDNLTTPVYVTAVSDPVASGIVKSVDDSGHDYITAFTDPGRFERQVRLFHNVVKFKKLGILYTDTDAGRTYAALEDVKSVANDLGFEVIGETDLIEADSDPKAPAKYLEALKRLAPKVDAVYLTIQAGLTDESIGDIMKVINEHKLPTFSMEQRDYVQRGVLMSISAYEDKSVGQFGTDIIVKLLKGEKAREQNMIFNITPSIAVNLKEAEKIGFDIPVDILGSADEVFNDIIE